MGDGLLMGTMSKGGGDGMSEELSYNRVRPYRYLYQCSKCDEYLDAGYYGGALKIASCKCVEVTA